jgi:hypothetical protein
LHHCDKWSIAAGGNLRFVIDQKTTFPWRHRAGCSRSANWIRGLLGSTLKRSFGDPAGDQTWK